MYGETIASPVAMNDSVSTNSLAAASTTSGSDQTVERGPTLMPLRCPTAIAIRYD